MVAIERDEDTVVVVMWASVHEALTRGDVLAEMVAFSVWTTSSAPRILPAIPESKIRKYTMGTLIHCWYEATTDKVTLKTV